MARMSPEVIHFNGGRFERTAPGVYSEQGQMALADDVTWVHQLAFDQAFAKATGISIDYDERWSDLMIGPAGRYSFTSDDMSFT